MKVNALCVAVNDYRDISRLNGCMGDSEHVGVELRSRGAEVRWLTQQRAFREQWLGRFEWLREADYWIMHYSGHGTHMADRSGDEVDGQDEHLCPYDADPSSYWERGMIGDDELATLLPRKPGLLILDCCHSGSSYREVMVGNPHPILNRSTAVPLDIGLRTMEPGRKISETLSDKGDPLWYIGASSDSEVAADYYEARCQRCATKPRTMVDRGLPLFFHGALSSALLATLWAHPEAITFETLQAGIRSWFRGESQFRQHPSFALSGSATAESVVLGPVIA